jgi:hypothetical protein
VVLKDVTQSPGVVVVAVEVEILIVIKLRDFEAARELN